MKKAIAERLPEGMRLATWDALQAMTEDTRQRVLERAAILHYEAGMPWPEVDAAALEQELPQRRLAHVG